MSDISNEYAEALFSLAVENGSERAIMKELEGIKAVFDENAELCELLSSPAVPINDRIDVIDSVFSECAQEYVISFIKLLCEKRRASIFFECVEKYRALLDAKEATVTASVTSAVALTDAEKAALKQKLEKMSGKTVVLECSIDPSILGGLIVTMDGTVTDGSLRHRLHEVKEVMSR